MRQLALVLLCSLLLACGTVYRVNDDIVVDRPPGGSDHLLQVNLDDFHFPDQETPAKTAYNLAVTDTSGGNRNRLQMVIMTAADKNCAIHKSRALATFNNINLVPGLLAAGLSGAAAVTKGSIATHLAAGAGFMQAARTEANTDIYRQALIEAVFKAIDNERQRIEQIIRARLKEPTTQYPVDESIRDAYRYADACSIYQGVELLNQAVANTNPCKVLRDRLAALEADIAKTSADDKTILDAKNNEYKRLSLQLSACAGTE